ncbi:hypothetical protein CHUAL_003610 [Chamberlinius hualienensis]
MPEFGPRKLLEAVEDLVAPDGPPMKLRSNNINGAELVATLIVGAAILCCSLGPKASNICEIEIISG